MTRGLPHIFGRVFNAPLAITPARLDPLIAGLRAASLRRGALADAQDGQRPAPAMAAQDGAWQRTGGGYLVSPGGVAWVRAHGVLVKREGEVTADSTELESYARISGKLARAAGDPAVRGIMLDIDTPGGEVGGLWELVGDIRAVADVKPVWAIANDDALSAGYAIASAAGRVFLTEVGGVGSVGVVAMHCDQSGFDAAEGLVFTYVHAGARKVDGNPHEPLSDAARVSIQGEVDRLYAMFIDMVATHRGLEAETVRATEAGVIFGPEAVAAGFADQIGTFPEAVTEMGDYLASPGRTMHMVDGTDTTAAAEDTPVTAEPPATVADALEAPAGGETSTVVRLDLVRQATATVRRESAEIVALCNLAGLPALAQDFIARGTPLNAVRTDLQRRQAEASEATPVEIVTTAPPPARPDGAVSELTKVLNARWAAQMGRA